MKGSTVFDRLGLGARLSLKQTIIQALEKLANDSGSIQETDDTSRLILSGDIPSDQRFDAKALQNRDRSRQSYVMQMQKIAANPDYDRVSASKTADSGAPMVFVRNSSIPIKQSGKKETVTMADGKGGTAKIPVVYAVVEADSAIASHDASGNKVDEYGGSTGIMALNNGRTAALKQAYRQGTASGYKEALKADQSSHGISADVIDKMESPILVRVFSEASIADIDDPGTASNISSGAQLSASEQAESDAKRLDESVVMQYAGGDINNHTNRDFVRAFIASVGGADAVGDMTTSDGLISATGIKRIEGALVAKAYGDQSILTDLTENPDDDLKSLGNVLRDIAGRWSVMTEAARGGAIASSVDITKNLTDAVSLIRKARQQGKRLSELVNQNDMFSGGINPVTEQLLRLMFRGDDFNRVRSAEKIKKALHGFLDKAMATTEGADMFGYKVDPLELIEQQKGTLEAEENASKAQKGLFDSIADYLAIWTHELGVFDSLAEAAKAVDTNPTEAQKKAGNYSKGHVNIHGLKAVIENPKGSKRTGTDKDGKQWESIMNAHYGYFKGSRGADGDEVDVFFGPDAEKPNPGIFVVNQNHEDGSFDEHKVMFGYPDEKAAKTAYLVNYDKGWTGLGSIKALSIDEFRKWLFSDETKAVLDAAQHGNTQSSPVVRLQQDDYDDGIQTIVITHANGSRFEEIRDWGHDNNNFYSYEFLTGQFAYKLPPEEELITEPADKYSYILKHSKERSRRELKPVPVKEIFDSLFNEIHTSFFKGSSDMSVATVFDSLSFREARSVRKLIMEGLEKLEDGNVGFRERRSLRKQIIDGLKKLGSKEPEKTKDFSHLTAITERLERERERLASATSEDERKFREVQVSQAEKELRDERKFLGLPEKNAEELLEEDKALLSELGVNPSNNSTQDVKPTENDTDFPVDVNDDDSQETKREPTAKHYPDGGVELSASKRKKANAAAIAILDQVNSGELDAEELTDAQKAQLAEYSGNGGGLIGRDGKVGSPYEYYTAKPLAAAGWELLKGAGFAGGKVLDPSAGTGIFGATAPVDAVVDAVELDETSGGINQILNGGNGNVTISAFEAVAAATPDNSYDAVITNIPFGDNSKRGLNKTLDEKYQKESLEGYFILRSLDKLKPGGTAVFISSSSFIQGKGYERLREKAALKAEFLGAYRLPNAQETDQKTRSGKNKEVSTFAGADVTSDVLVFRKHNATLQGIIYGLYQDGRGDLLQESHVMWLPFVSGNYFKSEGKRYVLGEETTGMSKYGEVQRVISKDSIKATAKLMKPFPGSRIDYDVLKKVAEDYHYEDLDEIGEPDPAQYAEGDVVYVGGQQMIYRGGEFVKGAKTENDTELDVKLVKLQSPLHALQSDMSWDKVDAIISNLSERSRYQDIPGWLKEVRIALNSVPENKKSAAYSLMVAALSSRQVFDQHAHDIPFDYLTTYPELSKHLELYAPQKRLLPSGMPPGINAANKFMQSLYDKKSGFSPLWKGEGEVLDTIAPEGKAKKYDHLRYTEADENGFVPLSKFKEVMPDVDPFTDDEFCLSPDGMGVMHANDFYHGNYQDFLNRNRYPTSKDAIKAASGRTLTDDEAEAHKDKFMRQMANAQDRLIKVDPAYMRFNLDSPFVSVERKVEFLNKYIKDANNGFQVEVDEKGRPSIGYKESMAGKADAANEDEFKERKRNIKRFYQYLKNKTLTTGETKENKLADPKLEKQRMERLKLMISEMNQQFESWAKSNPGVQRSIEQRLNDPNNLFFHEEDEGDLLDIPGINPEFVPHDYQNASIRRYARRMTGILGHDVGLGKTSQALLVAQHIQNIGVKKKTMFVVPNSTMSNWRKETSFVYQDNSDCLFIGLDVKTDKVGNEIEATVKPGNYGKDLMTVLQNKHRKIFITYSAFEMIPLKDETLGDYINYVQSVDSSFDAEGSSNKTKSIQKESRLANLKLGKKNESFPYFEDLGVDSLNFDEAHLFKNSKSTMEFKGAKQLSLAPASNRGLDGQIKSWWIRNQSKLGDGVLSLTATPITNSPLEMYSMLSLSAGEEELNRRMGGIRGADEFMEAFCQIDELESENLIGEVKLSRVFTGLTNSRMLSEILHGMANIRNAKDVALKIPEYDDVPTTVALPESTKKQLASMKAIYAAARDVEEATESGGLIDKDQLDLVQSVGAVTGESISLLAHPFNLINKMSKLILDEDLHAQATIYQVPDEQKAAADKAIADFNKLKVKDERPEGRMTPAFGTDRVLLGQKTRKDENGEDIVFDIVHVQAKWVEGRIVIDTDDFEVQNKFLRIAQKHKLDLNVSISAKMAAFIENFKAEAATPKSPKDPDAKPRMAKQIVFCDMLGMQNKIKIALTKLAGVSASKIMIVNGKSVSDPADMQDVQDGFNAEGDDNRYSVVIANQKAEVGINLQKGCQAIHHLTVGWTPDSLQQRNGRGVRQGNYVEHMRVYHYDADGTFDEYKRDLVGVKSDWIGQLLDRKNTGDVKVGGAMSREDMDDLVEATGDAESVRKVRERKAAREAMARQQAEHTKVIGNLTSMQSNQDTLDKYENFRDYLDEKLVAVLKLMKSVDAAKARLKKESEKAKPNTAKIAQYENQVKQGQKYIDQQSKPIKGALKFIDNNDDQNPTLTFEQFFNARKRDQVIKDGGLGYAYGSSYGHAANINEESPLKESWQVEIDTAKKMLEELQATAKESGEKIGISANRIDAVYSGEAITFRGKIIAVGDMVEVDNGTLYMIRHLDKEGGEHKLFTVTEDLRQRDGDYSLLSTGTLITREDPEYDAYVKQAVATDKRFADKSGGVTHKVTRGRYYAGKHRIQFNVRLFEHFNEDVAAQSDLDRDHYLFDDGANLDPIRLDKPIYPRIIKDDGGFDLLQHLAEEQRNIIRRTESGKWQIRKTDVAALDGVDIPTSELIDHLLRQAEVTGYKIVGNMEFSRHAGMLDSDFGKNVAKRHLGMFPPAEALTDILKEVDKLEDIDGVVIAFMKKTFHLMDFSSMADDAIVRAADTYYKEFGIVSAKRYELKDAALRKVADLVGREVLGENPSITLVDLINAIRKAVNKRAAELHFIIGHATEQMIEEVANGLHAPSHEANPDAPQQSDVPVSDDYDVGYTTSDDGMYVCIKMSFKAVKDGFKDKFKKFCKDEGEYPLWWKGRGAYLVRNPPENSWILRKDIYEALVEEYPDEVRKYEITQV